MAKDCFYQGSSQMPICQGADLPCALGRPDQGKILFEFCRWKEIRPKNVLKIVFLFVTKFVLVAFTWGKLWKKLQKLCVCSRMVFLVSWINIVLNMCRAYFRPFTFNHFDVNFGCIQGLILHSTVQHEFTFCYNWNIRIGCL